LSFLFFIEGLFSFLSLNALLSLGVELSVVKGFMVGLVSSIQLNGLDLALNVRGEVLLFELLPPIAVHLDTAKGVLLLIFGELTVLATAVEADYILDLGLLVRFGIDFRPFLLLRLVLRSFIVLSFLFSISLLLLFPFGLLLLLLTASSDNILHLLDTSVKGSFVKAGVVLKSDRHVRSQSRHLEVVHTGFTDNLLDYFMDGKLLRNWLGGFNRSSFRSFLIGLGLGFTFYRLRIVKDIESKSLFFG